MTKENNPRPRFGPGDTIESGGVYWTIQRATRTHYQLTSGTWMPAALVDRYWSLVDLEGEIEDE